MTGNHPITTGNHPELGGIVHDWGDRLDGETSMVGIDWLPTRRGNVYGGNSLFNVGKMEGTGNRRVQFMWVQCQNRSLGSTALRRNDLTNCWYSVDRVHCR